MCQERKGTLLLKHGFVVLRNGTIAVKEQGGIDSPMSRWRPSGVVKLRRKEG